jgi:hypothetical protein
VAAKDVIRGGRNPNEGPPVHTFPSAKQPLHRRTRHLHRTAAGSALVALALVAALADGAASSATATTVPTNRLANPSF